MLAPRAPRSRLLRSRLALPLLALTLALLALTLWTPPAAAGPAALASAGDLRSASRSIGWPWRGRLRAGQRLAPTDRLRLVDENLERGFFFGTVELVAAIEHAASFVASRAPGARLNVGELSRSGGGNVPGHRSHENGRDVDLGFYLLDEAGVAIEPGRFVQLRRNGRGSYGGGPVRFDLARNWLLMEALLSAPELTVQHVFVNRALRASLLRHGRRSGASAELLERAARVILPPLGSSHPHLNHFHVRIYCPADDIGAADGVPGCRDRGPFFPWLPVDHPFAPASAHPSRAP